MRSGAKGRPVFVAGAPRSGIGILTWSLAQHPSFEVVPESGWIGRLSMQLAGTYAAGRDEGRWIGHPGSVTSPDAFLGAFGPAVEATLGLPPRRPTAGGNRDDEEGSAGRRSRWISGSADHSLHIYGLSRLFPEARFIHVVREPSAVVRSLVQVATPDGAYYTERSAVETWLRCVKACLEAERALGAGRILRVHHEELTREPKRLLLRCLAFLEEPFDPVCLRPLRGLESPGHEEPENRAKDGRLREDSHRAEALRLWARLVSHPQRRAPDPAALARLQETSLAMGGNPDPRLRPAFSADRIREFARAVLPEGARVLVVSRGDPDLVQI
ncbi:MAG: sulfotransferase family protein, partial [bacterium]